MNGGEQDDYNIQRRDAKITTGRKPLKRRGVVALTSTTLTLSKKQRRRRIQPVNMEYVDKVNGKDFLCGRGSRSNLHPCNKAYLKFVDNGTSQHVTINQKGYHLGDHEYPSIQQC